MFQRGILILGLAMFPIWALWLNAESILLLVQQVPCVARFVHNALGSLTILLFYTIHIDNSKIISL